ncbi:major facilitator superfamily domain-containing protein [Melanogaster broomeanus]|nr:major facilitator superfamily domain-containing protein [Melanogaster broomeanus]
MSGSSLTTLAEPLTSQLIAPFAPQMIRDIGVINGDETKVGYYHSIFFATQALTVLHWSRLSDHIGRKPVILSGLFGLSASMYCSAFLYVIGFAQRSHSRAFSGALNGNAGVMKSVVVEITDSTNIAQAYAYMPNSVVDSPFIGGSLARPADRFPSVFGDRQFFKKYPYFLACAVPATFSAVACLVAYLHLQETLPHPIPLRRLIRSKFTGGKKAVAGSLPTTSDVSTRLLTAENLEDPAKDDDTRPLPLRALLIPHVLIAVGNYAAISILEIALRAIQPVFYATPIELGGLGLDPPRIGNILSINGVVSALFQMFFFADLHDRFGTKVIYFVSMTSAIPLVLTYPVINALGRAQGLNWLVWSVIGLQLALSIVFGMTYSCILIYIAAAAPNRRSLGATNGLAQILVSITRSIGPVSATSMFSLSIQTPEHAWYAYYFLMTLVCIGIGASLLLPRKLWTRD